MQKRVTLFLFIFLISLTAVEAKIDCLPQKPNPPRLVNDFAKVLPASTVSQLERRLVVFNDTTSTQITLVTVNDLCGYEASQFATELGHEWRVGDEKFDNGIVILFKPKTASSKGQVFIATGYGLEGVLPDAIGKRIVENEMIPFFKQNQIEQGLLNGIQVTIDIVGGEYSAENYNARNGGKKSFPFLFVLIAIVIILARTMGRARRYSRTNNTGLWAALWLLGSSGRSHGGHFDNFGSGGGGFGGFGGGGFGGGGAGGSW